MRRTLVAFSTVAFALFSIPIVHGFFDQIDELKQELIGWQTTNAADFTDLMGTLDSLSARAFDDVNDSDWFSPYVATVSGWGVVSGYKDAEGNPLGKFGPANSVTVAELLKMSFKAAQADTSTCGAVAPVHQSAVGHWAQEYVSCGEQKDMRILRDLNLDINRTATRAEVISVMNDTFGENVPPLYSNFKDTQGHTLESDVAFAYTRGIVSGDKDTKGVETGVFRPNEAINRAEVAKIVYEWEKVKVKETARNG
jgi:hypothetical protein